MPSRSAKRDSKKSRELTAYLGHIVNPTGRTSYDDYRRGALLVDESGTIVAAGRADRLKESHAGITKIVDFGRKILMPGFIDMHLHLPQITEVGRTGHTLLGWLKNYIFPAETRFADTDYACRVAEWFFAELSRNGTTTGVVFPTIHAPATNEAFKTAARKGNRVVMGKVMMDANCPESLSEDCQLSLLQAEELAKSWHGHDNGRLLYAFTPRFAVTASANLLEGVGKIWARYPGTYLHTHLAENQDEVEFVKRQFPGTRSYTDVYDRYGLVGERSIFAHGIYLDGDDLSRLSQAGSAVAHCPSSNFFLKSGVFPYAQARERKVAFGLGSDVAGGPEMSMFRVMKDAAYMQQTQWLDARELFYLSTLGGARALGLDDRVGNFEPGKEADFIVVDPGRKSAFVRDVLDAPADDILSRLVYLGDDRLVTATYVRGRAIYQAEEVMETRVDGSAEAAKTLVKVLLDAAEASAGKKPRGAVTE